MKRKKYQAGSGAVFDPKQMSKSAVMPQPTPVKPTTGGHMPVSAGPRPKAQVRPPSRPVSAGPRPKAPTTAGPRPKAQVRPNPLQQAVGNVGKTGLYQTANLSKGTPSVKNARMSNVSIPAPERAPTTAGPRPKAPTITPRPIRGRANRRRMQRAEGGAVSHYSSIFEMEKKHS